MNRGGVCLLLGIILFFSCTSVSSAPGAQSVDIQKMYEEKQERLAATYALRYMEEILGKTMIEIGEAGLKNGIFSGIQLVVAGSMQACAAPLLQECARPVASCIKYPFSLTSKWLQLIMFGSRRLAWNDVVKLNNTVFDLIQPLVVHSLGDFTKERRAELVAAKQENTVLTDTNWQLKKESIVQELDYIIDVINEKVACYSTGEQDSVVRKALDKIYALFTIEQRDQIAHWLQRAAHYCSDMRRLVSEIAVTKQLEEQRDSLRFVFTSALRSLKMVATYINEDLASMPAGSFQPGYLKFKELSTQSNSSLAGLDALFADGNAAPANN